MSRRRFDSVRRCTHRDPIVTHSSHTCAAGGLTVSTASMCEHSPRSVIISAPFSSVPTPPVQPSRLSMTIQQTRDRCWAKR